MGSVSKQFVRMICSVSQQFIRTMCSVSQQFVRTMGSVSQQFVRTMCSVFSIVPTNYVFGFLIVCTTDVRARFLRNDLFSFLIVCTNDVFSFLIVCANDVFGFSIVCTFFKKTEKPSLLTAHKLNQQLTNLSFKTKQVYFCSKMYMSIECM